MAEMGWPDVEQMSPEIDEYGMGDRSTGEPVALTQLIARAKAEALQERLRHEGGAPALVICSDQVCVCEGVIREKPSSPEQARQFLQSYSAGKPVETCNAVCVLNTETGVFVECVDRCVQSFKPIPEAHITTIVEAGRIYDSAGGFQIEDELFVDYVGDFEGTPESIRGLPVQLTLEMLLEAAA